MRRRLPRQRHEEIARNPIEKEHGQKDDADAKRRDQSRHRNLSGAQKNRFFERQPFLKIALDVFDSYRGIIDQDSDSQSEAAKRQ